VSHRHIPDDPMLESERRQIFFGMAVGIPTFYVRRSTRNRFLLRILRRTRNIRSSNRYPGYWRVQNREYCLALLDLLAADAADLIEAAGLAPLLADLKLRITRPEAHSAAGRLTRGILDQLGARHPHKVRATEFNRAAEHYYRDELNRRHLREALSFLEQDLYRLPPGLVTDAPLARLLENRSAIFSGAELELSTGVESMETVSTLLNLMLLNFSMQTRPDQQKPSEASIWNANHPSIHRAG
jgi:hypothetical protein